MSADACLDALAAALREGGALVHQDRRFVLVRQGRERACGDDLQDLALSLAAVAGAVPRRGPRFQVWLAPDLLKGWGLVRRRNESLSAFVRAAMRREIMARQEGARTS